MQWKLFESSFDLLMVNGDDLRRKPYAERKSALRKLLRHGRGIQYVEHAEGHGGQIICCRLQSRAGGDCFKEARRALSVGPIENLDQSQKSEAQTGEAATATTGILAMSALNWELGRRTRSQSDCLWVQSPRTLVVSDSR